MQDMARALRAVTAGFAAETADAISTQTKYNRAGIDERRLDDPKVWSGALKLLHPDWDRRKDAFEALADDCAREAGWSLEVARAIAGACIIVYERAAADRAASNLRRGEKLRELPAWLTKFIGALRATGASDAVTYFVCRAHAKGWKRNRRSGLGRPEATALDHIAGLLMSGDQSAAVQAKHRARNQLKKERDKAQ
jgi:hypothetical protein